MLGLRLNRGGTMQRWTGTRLLIWIGCGLLVAPSLAILGSDSAVWEVQLVQWFGLSVALLGWAAASMIRRGLEVDQAIRVTRLMGLGLGFAGILSDDPLLTLLGFSVTIACVCRAGLVIGFDVHRTALDQLDR